VVAGFLALALVFGWLNKRVPGSGSPYLYAGSFNPSHLSLGGSISTPAAIALFSYIGLETASVAAGRVRNPGRNVSRPTVLGTLAAARLTRGRRG
jgi:amino acid transporter